MRREDERAEELRRFSAEVVVGDLTDPASVHSAVEGCRRIYFGMSVSASYLEATVNIAAVARHFRPTSPRWRACTRKAAMTAWPGTSPG